MRETTRHSAGFEIASSWSGIQAGKFVFLVQEFDLRDSTPLGECEEFDLPLREFDFSRSEFEFRLVLVGSRSGKSFFRC